MRRGYHILPKHMFGQPTDAFFHHGPQIQNWMAPSMLTVLLRILVGEVRRLGLPKPDHPPLSTHPIMNTQMLHHLARGDIAETGEDLYLNIFSRDHPGLFVMGFFGTAGAAYPIVSKQGALIASVISAREKKNERAIRAFDALRAAPRSLKGGMRYVGSPRHAFYVQFETYLKELNRVRARVERAAGT